jgi:hypothetical protein
MVCAMQTTLRIGTSVSTPATTSRTSVLELPRGPTPAFVALLVQTTEAFDVHD